MSEITIVKFNKDGEAFWHGEVNNSMRGAMAVWTELGRKYVSDSFSTLEAHKAWDLQYRDDVTDEEKIVLYSTFDKALVEKEHLGRLIKAYKSFSSRTNLEQQAELLKEIEEQEDVTIVGFSQTSTVENRWLEHDYDEENEEWITYNPYKEIDHFYIDTDLVLTYRIVDNKEKGRLEKVINMGNKIVVYDVDKTKLTKEDIETIKEKIEDVEERIVFITKESEGVKIGVID